MSNLVMWMGRGMKLMILLILNEWKWTHKQKAACVFF
jgi:hypothetical protein